MPERGAASTRVAAVAAPAPGSWCPPAPRSPDGGGDLRLGGLAGALLTWADQDDGCLVLLDEQPHGEPVVRWLNSSGAQLLGYDVSELRGLTLDRLLRSPFAAAEVDEDDEPMVDRRRAVHRPLSVQRRDGSSLRVLMSSVPVSVGDSVSWMLRLVPEPDVDRVAEALHASHERFRALAERAPIAIFCSESGLRLAYVNDQLCELYGQTAERLSGMGWLTQVHPIDRGPIVDAMTRVLQGEPQELPLRVVRPDGEERFVQARIAPVPHGRRDAGFVGTFDDITERRAAEVSLAFHASHDPLTGLLNRRRLLELLADDLQVSVRASDRPALLFLDLDDFKQVNDSLGHEAGDRLLLEVARRLTGAVREGDVVSRFGGDEFAVLCRGVADDVAAGEVARRLLVAVTGDVLLGATLVPVSGSIGVVVAGPRHLEAEDVLRDADVAMYQAKAAGKDCWALFDEQARIRLQARLDLARDLRVALDEDRLAVHYQPIVTLDPTRSVPVLASVEALARWSHAEHGNVPPSEFVEIAEENGLVSQLGLAVLRAACRQMVQWRAQIGDRAPASVSVNVSAIQLRENDFPDVVERVLLETGLPGSALCLELTESVVLHDSNAAAACFQRLRALGVRISIDDFGTGYSSLSVLRRMPLDQLKIDRSLLPDLSRDTHDPVVAAVVALGHAMDLSVVAEGVETCEQEAELRRLGCPLAQGFLFGRPMPPAQLAGWAMDHAVPARA